MAKPLKLVAANDTFGALVAVTEALAGKHALFITPPETNGLMPEVHGLPDSVSDEVAFLVQSSGSTGTPKLIQLSAEAAIASAQASAARLGGTGQWLLALPLSYIAGLNVLIRSAVAETQPVMMNPSVPFTAEAFTASTRFLSAEKKFTALVPTQLSRLAIAAQHDESVLIALRSYSAILVGGQAAAPALLSDLREQNVNIVETYGAAETFGGVVYDGVPLQGVDIALDEDSKIVVTSAVGKYISNDLGEFVDRKLQVLGRADRVIISGGLKISLDRVEAIAREVAGVVEMVAAPITDSEWGQRVGVIYLGSPEVADEIATQLADLLGPVAKPLRVLRVDQVPKLSNGKYDLLAAASLFEKDGND
ncbi:MAG: AMP-binding protein [Micrococcales bacterium]